MKQFIIISTIILLIVLYLKRKNIMKIFDEKISDNFTFSEFAVTNTGLKNDIPESIKPNIVALVINTLQPIRDLFNKPVIISSGYRSEAVNKAVGGVSNSQHLTGKAADFIVKGVDLNTVYNRIKHSAIPYDQLIIEHNKATGKRWIHVSFNKYGNRLQAFSLTIENEKI